MMYIAEESGAELNGCVFCPIPSRETQADQECRGPGPAAPPFPGMGAVPADHQHGRPVGKSSFFNSFHLGLRLSLFQSRQDRAKGIKAPSTGIEEVTDEGGLPVVRCSNPSGDCKGSGVPERSPAMKIPWPFPQGAGKVSEINFNAGA